MTRVELSNAPPAIHTKPPGPKSRALAQRLRKVECQNVTCLEPTAPIFWERAQGSNVWDVDGNRYVDLGAAFGVSAVGHAHPRVVAAVKRQAESLLHGMGDVYPPAIKVELLEALCARYPGGGPARAVLGSSGADAVETAIKTAMLATGKPGLLAFEGAYHGLSLGALDATWRPDFRAPFSERLAKHTAFARFGQIEDVERAAREASFPIGALIVEPIQGRGGERVPPDGFLTELRNLCTERAWLLILDEIYSGCGRTGTFFACEREGVVPDLLCVGKGLASGMPFSACLGRPESMDRWPVSTGEAIHTQTFLGHPPGCAAALASLAILEDELLPERAARLGTQAMARLKRGLRNHPGIVEVRGRGLMLAIECDSASRAGAACSACLERGVIVLPSGNRNECLSITPPLTIDEALFFEALESLMECIPR